MTSRRSVGGSALALAAATALLAPAPAGARGTDPSLVLDPEVGPAGATVRATGQGFADACGVRLFWDDVGGLVLGDAPTKQDGSFDAEIVVPDVPAPDPHQVLAHGLAVDANGRCAGVERTAPQATADFFVEPAPPPPVAQIEPSGTTVAPGGALILDASGSSGGPPIAWNFDLNGNGSYETKCDQPAAALVSNKKGNYTVGVQVVGAGGSTDTEQVAIEVAGPLADPPPKPGGGSYKPFFGGSKAGACVEAGTDILDAQIKIYKCPSTVSVGVAEAVIPPDLPQDLCFERKNAGTILELFVAKSKEVLLNGLRIDTLDDRLQLASKLKIVGVDGYNQKDSDAKFKVSQPGYASTIGTAPFYLNWKVGQAGVVGNVPLASPLGAGRFLGLPYAPKTSPLKLTAGGGAELQLYLELPLPQILFDGLSTSNALTVRVNNTDGIQFEGGYKIKIADVYLGLFTLKGIEISYQKQGNSNVWSGGFGLEFPSSGVSANGNVVVRDGVLESLTASYNPGPPGVGPIGCCVFIIGFDGALTNEYIQAGATFAAGPQVVGDTRAADAHGSATIYYEPFEFLMTVDDVHIVGYSVNANGEVSVTLSSFEFKAGFDEDFGPFSFDGTVNSKVWEDGGLHWYAAGGGEACIDWVDICADGSGAAGPKGVSGCGKISIKFLPDPAGGAVVYWGGGFDVFGGCSFGKVKSKVGAKRAAALRAKQGGGATFDVEVPGGAPAVLFEIKGEGNAPQVTLEGPDGTSITTPMAGAPPVGDGETYFAAAVPDEEATYVVVGDEPAGGTWHVTEEEGSAPVQSIGLAKRLPGTIARGQVSGNGRKRVLHYDVADVPGVKVVFVERGSAETPEEPGDVVDEEIGEVNGGTGALRFTPAEAKVRKRRIDAVVMSQGLAVETETVDSFKAPKFRRLRGPNVDPERRGKRLHVSWSKVPGAVAYRVIADVSDDPTRGFEREAGELSINLKGLTKHSDARIEVRAISEAGYLGKPGVGKLK